MKRSTKKLISIFCVAFFILSIAVPALAASDNRVDRTPQVEDGYEFTSDKTYPTLTIEEKNEDEFKKNDYFELALTNAEWADATTISGIATDNIDIDKISSKLLGITITDADDSDIDIIKVPLLVKIKGDGEAKVTVDPRDSAVTGGTYTFAVSATGKTISSISKVEKFAGRTGELAVIRIDETRIGSLGTGSQTIKIKLPPKFVWTKEGEPSGLVDEYISGSVKGLQTRTLEFEVDLDADRGARGSIFIKGLEITADRDAPYGDIVVDMDGDNVTADEVVVAKRLDYDAEVTVKEVKELFAGRAEEETAEIKIKANVKGALIDGREISVVLPKWVKISSAKLDGALLGAKYIDDNALYVKVDGDKAEYKLKLKLSIEANETGDIVAEFSGAGMEEQELVIAEAVAPVTADVAAADLKIGVQNQAAPDITITETKKGAIDGDELTITLPKGIKFASTPEVEVTEGNLEIKKPKVVDEDNKLKIGIKSTSTKPSTIKISDIKLTLDRTVPEGEFKASIGGNAIVKNSGDDEDYYFKNTDYVVKFVFANVITPAPGETRATSIFTIGGTTYTVMEQNTTVEKTMDVAPYLEGGRTFLPLRYVANALGVNDDNIIWDPVTKAVTIFKGDRIAQVTIGSKTMLVNGVTVNMDVAPEITDERTMLPIRWMGQALGATIDWDAEARSVTVKQ